MKKRVLFAALLLLIVSLASGKPAPNIGQEANCCPACNPPEVCCCK